MEEALYRVVITGRMLGSFSRHHAVAAFARLFSISQEEADGRFDHAPCVVRGLLSLVQAEKYCRVMQREGIECLYEQDEPKRQLAGIYPSHLY